MKMLLIQFSPLLVTLGGAILFLLLMSWWKKLSGEVLVVIASMILCALIVFSWRGLIGSPVFIGSSFPLPFQLDHLSYLAFMLFAIASGISIISSYNYVTLRGENVGGFIALMLFSVFGAQIMASSNDLVALFIGLEIMSLPAYVLAGFNRDDPVSKEASIKYFILGAAASAIFLFGIAFYYGASGSFAITALRPELPNQALFLISSALMISGLGFKVAAVPFQWWTPDVYTGSPLPVTTYFATTVKAAAFIAFYRIALALLPMAGDTVTPMFVVLAVATITLANLSAIYQDNVKRMLAYSSIAHAGYLLIAFAFIGRDAITARESIVFYLFSYMAMTAGAFLVLTMLKKKGSVHELTDIADLAGLGRRSPWLALSFSLFLLSLAGFPPTAGFFAKFYLFKGAVDNGLLWLALVGVINSLVSVYYYMRPVVKMYFGNEPHVKLGDDEYDEIEYSTAGAIIFCAVLVVILGLFPSKLLSIIGM